MMRRILTALAFFSSLVLLGQQTPIDFSYGNNEETFITCDGFIIDSGGQGGPGYSNNEHITITICPDTISTGDNSLFITTTFNLFELDETNTGTVENPDLDVMSVYNGPSVSSPTYGSYYADELQNVSIAASGENESGCLTFVFHSNSSGTGMFTANAVCTQPCSPPTVDAFIMNGDAPDSISVCVGASVTFDGTASMGADGLGISEYNWNFSDGNVELDSGPIVSHVFTEPGQYPVLLTVIDDNDGNECASTNVVPLNVYVSNYPTYDQFPSDMTICVGEMVDLVGIYDLGVYDSTWTGFPQTFPVDGCLPDTLLGVAQSFPFTFSEFDPLAVVSSADDVGDICVNMEHSYMGDLVIQLSCPNGTTITLQSQGGGATQIGVPHQQDVVDCPNATGIGEGWDYCWNESAEQTWTEWVDAQIGFDLTLEEGTYAPYDSMSELIGCPLVGTWQLTVIDNWAADDGKIFDVGIEFAPSFYQDNVQFTNTIGEDSDSSHWDLTSPYIIGNSLDLNQITIAPEAIGTYDYDYWVVNDFGCEFDTTVTVDVIDGPEITAGPDLYFCQDPVQLLGGVLGGETASCSNDGGLYTYCYGNNEIFEVTYCPDNSENGETMMTIEFLSGELEGFSDWINIYNGPNTGSPWLGSPWEEDLTGLSYTASNETGCITFTINSDGANSCADGTLMPIEVLVGCTVLDGMEWNWEPPLGLSDPVVSNPMAAVEQETSYVLSGFPVGFPACVKTDTVMVSVTPYDAVIDTIFGPLTYCEGDVLTFAVEALPDAESYEWSLPEGWTGDSDLEFIMAESAEEGLVGVRAFNGCGFTDLFELEVTEATIETAFEYVEGPEFVCILAEDTVYTYTVDGDAGEYYWEVTGATSTDLTTSTNSIEIQWVEEGLQSISMVPINECGEGPVSVLNVDVSYCLGSSFTEIERLFSIYPNPAQSQFYIKPMSDDISFYRVVLYDMMGKELLVLSNENGEFDISQFASGAYLLHILVENQLIQQERLIIE